MYTQAELVSPQDTNTTQAYDAIIIGAGLGGLLSAAQLLQRDKKILIVERLPHCGGRFTSKTFQGVQVSTGAVHMVPFGSSGVLSQMLQHLHIPHYFFDADVFGSFHVHGKQYSARGILGVFQFLGPRQFALLVSLGYRMFLRPLPEAERTQPYDVWLKGHIDVARNPQLVGFFASIARFALSLELSQVSVAEVSAITKNMFRYGAPAIVRGGCGGLTGTLEQHVLTQGATLLLTHEVLQILQEDGRVTGIRMRDKTNGQEALCTAPVIVSDIGPRATEGLLHNHRVTQSEVLRSQNIEGHPQGDAPPIHEVVSPMPTSYGKGIPLRVPLSSTQPSINEAVGLKIHILSDVSLIPHKGIMYCLDTQRIAGMVQPTNSDPQLAPPGKHLLISHQVIRSNNVEEERALALADLRFLFGETFDKHCRILTMGTYRGEWPVNRIAQGEDTHVETTIQGLYLVGDAVKPSGYLMVEGVAQSVNRFLDVLDDHEQTPLRQSHVLPPPPRRHALRWLFRAPGNSRDSRKDRRKHIWKKTFPTTL